MEENAEYLLKKITSKTALIGVVGSGYVGGSVADAAVNAGYHTLGFDIDPRRVEAIKNQKRDLLDATTEMQRLSECDVICICVPTPVNRDNSPNLEIIKTAAKTVGTYLHKGTLVITESSIAPGTSRNILLPLLSANGNVVGRDFYLGYSPERIDPGNKKYNMKQIPKVVAGYDEHSEILVQAFYRQLVDTIVPVSSIETAELTKVFENVFRLVNISLVNEIAEYATAMGVDAWEMIDAAATKPFGFLAHYPGPGAGGDCIPVLPYHLLQSANDRQLQLPLVECAAKINDQQPQKVVKKTLSALNGKHTHPNGHKPKVMLVGVSYKPDNADIRQSVALKIWDMLEEEGVTVTYHDPYVQEVNGASSTELNSETMASQDAIIITTAHTNIEYTTIVDSKRPVIDTRNKLKKIVDPNIIRI